MTVLGDIIYYEIKFEVKSIIIFYNDFFTWPELHKLLHGKTGAQSNQIIMKNRRTPDHDNPRVSCTLDCRARDVQDIVPFEL